MPQRAFFFFFCFLGPHLWHMEVPRLEGESELQLLVYATHSNLGSKLRLQRTLLLDTSQVRYCWAMMGTPAKAFLRNWIFQIFFFNQSSHRKVKAMNETMNLHTQKCFIRKTAFCVWLISLSIMFSRFIPVAENGSIPFFWWLNSIPLYIYDTTFSSFHLSMDI